MTVPAHDSPDSPDPRTELALILEATPWALAAMIGTMRDAATAPLDEVLAAHPRRTAVLEAAGLVRRDGDAVTVDPVLDVADAASAHSAVAARLSALRQAVTVAASEQTAGAAPAWERHDDDVLLNQGRASAGTGRALATRIVPALPGLAERLARPGSRVLDVGTGVAALALALATALPAVEVVGIDVMRRVLDLAGTELAEADPAAAGRVTLRLEDVGALSEEAAYDLVWLPAPFLSDAALQSAIPRVFRALRPGGWVVAGTNPAPEHPLHRAVAAWTAELNGGSSSDTASVEEALVAAGFRDERRYPTVPGGPVLVAAQR
ncbi:SAM-dependent methyltransferase [Catenulispora rubra]|uniref:SAM-dependent methyltransferase n=1 Tax=Catenulispora rubra TaxID=280293 RepID=UPI00189273A9|nr:class I SAM-dependent methyltransferase [Catenulispora rubra]